MDGSVDEKRPERGSPSTIGSLMKTPLKMITGKRLKVGFNGGRGEGGETGSLGGGGRDRARRDRPRAGGRLAAAFGSALWGPGQCQRAPGMRFGKRFVGTSSGPGAPGVERMLPLAPHVQPTASADSASGGVGGGASEAGVDELTSAGSVSSDTGGQVTRVGWGGVSSRQAGCPGVTAARCWSSCGME